MKHTCICRQVGTKTKRNKKKIIKYYIALIIMLVGCPLNAMYPEPVEGKLSETVDIDIGHLMAVENISSPYSGFQYSGGASFKLTLPLKAGLYFYDINITSDKDETHLINLPVLVREKLSRTFKYTPPDEVKKIALAGSFNGWNQNKDILKDEDGDGVYSITKELTPGRHSYKFVVDGNWLQDTANPESEPDGFGGFNSIIEIKGPEFPSLYGVSEEIIDGNWEVKFIEAKGAAYKKMYAYYLGKKWEAEFSQSSATLLLPVGEGLETLYIWCEDADGSITNTKKILKNFSSDISWPERIIYSLKTDRFFNGDVANDNPVKNPLLHPKANFSGGDFKGITQKIEEGYFSKLGVNCLWISPVNDNPPEAWRDALPPHRYFSGYHGYWPVSHIEVEENFGTKEDLKELIRTANEHGIKIMGDFVFNHTHQNHPWYKEHPEWFGSLELPDGSKNIRRFDEHPFTTWFDEFLPSFDFSSSEAVEAVTDNAIWWIREFGFDALRLDAVKHIPHHFWRRLSEKINLLELSTGREFYMVGETIASRDDINSFIAPGGIDGQFDFPLYWHIRDVFALSRSNFKVLSAELASSRNNYKNIYYMATLIGNHDFDRFISLADGDIIGDSKKIGWENPPEVDNKDSYKKLKLAWTFMLTNPGIPTIYYGDEIGMSGAGDPDNRRMMRFEGLSRQEKGVFEHVRKLNKIRRDNPALTMGWHNDLLVEDALWVYLKHYFDSVVIVVLNNSLKEKKFDLNLPEEFIKDGTGFRDIFRGRVYKVKDGKLSGSVRPLDSVVMNIIER